jgi:type IV pilus assembly protein PilY1
MKRTQEHFMNISALNYKPLISLFLAGASLCCVNESAIAVVDLSNTPMTTSTATSVRPNLLFVLDDSGSMGWEYMPDWVIGPNALCRDSAGVNRKSCSLVDPPFMSADFNGIYYNPANTYQPPVNPNGTSRTNQFYLSGSTKRWDKVQTDPFLNATLLKNLESQYEDAVWCTSGGTASNADIAASLLPTATNCRRNGIAYTSSPAVTAQYNYPNSTYKHATIVNAGPYYYQISTMQWCKNQNSGPCQPRQDATYKYAGLPGYGNGIAASTMQRFNITPANCTPTCQGGRTYENEMTNFANWYAYYRTRINMAKTGVGRAFVGLDENYRAGFMTIHTTASDTSDYVPIQTYTLANKTTWFNMLYSITPNSGTPLRSALGVAGRMYAGKILTDPVQYSCQKNYTILSTDGYWNGSAGVDINGGAIGNQDNAEPRPKFDGNINPSVTAGSSSGGADTLADVAMYYYKTDLRDPSRSNCTGALPTTNVCANNVPPGKKDTASHQHMTTFTIGLGLDGLLEFRPDYETATVGTFSQIKSGSLNWGPAQENQPSAIDDLWHAAVNGSGTYYSAKNPQALTDGLGDALRDIGARNGAAAAASTSNPQVTTKDNFIFSSNYRTSTWDSVVRRQRIDVSSGDILKGVDWEAGGILNTMVSPASDVRTIYMFSGATANKLRNFEWATLTAAEKAHLDPATWTDPATKWTHWATLSAAGQLAGKAPGALVQFLRGQTGLQDDSGSPDKPFRGRDNVLGDIVNAETAYVKQAQFEYADAGYSAFKASTKTRQAVLYAAANDGMLHAFNADTGRELWAFIPSMVIPKLYKLAAKSYLHEFYVDGSPVVGDIFDGSAWRTILVGGLNKGGSGYYALDITDPLAPKALWEFCNDSTMCTQIDANMGQSYGNPVIAKLDNGDWSVMVTSGYNNADSKGYLYVLNPLTGAKKFPAIQTSCTSANCGLSKISAWTRSTKNNTAERIYGGDLDGNMWRFDINNLIAPAGREAFKLARVGDSATSLVQSITTKPELGLVYNKAVVFFGTGRFLGDSDKTDTSKNSFYAVVDDLSSVSLGNVRTSGDLVDQQLAAGTNLQGLNIRTNTNKVVDWSVKKGWYLDFPTAGERNFTDPSLILGTLAFTTNIPTTSDPCSGGGVSWLYQLDFKTGGSVNTAEKSSTGQLISAQYVANEYSTRPVPVQLPNGRVRLLTQINDGNIANNRTWVIMQFLGRRAGWREIIE